MSDPAFSFIRSYNRGRKEWIWVVYSYLEQEIDENLKMWLVYVSTTQGWMTGSVLLFNIMWLRRHCLPRNRAERWKKHCGDAFCGEKTLLLNSTITYGHYLYTVGWLLNFANWWPLYWSNDYELPRTKKLRKLMARGHKAQSMDISQLGNSTGSKWNFRYPRSLH